MAVLSKEFDLIFNIVVVQSIVGIFSQSVDEFQPIGTSVIIGIIDHVVSKGRLGERLESIAEKAHVRLLERGFLRFFEVEERDHASWVPAMRNCPVALRPKLVLMSIEPLGNLLSGYQNATNE
jgi:hypothetical protein